MIYYLATSSVSTNTPIYACKKHPLNIAYQVCACTWRHSITLSGATSKSWCSFHPRREPAFTLLINKGFICCCGITIKQLLSSQVFMHKVGMTLEPLVALKFVSFMTQKFKSKLLQKLTSKFLQNKQARRVNSILSDDFPNSRTDSAFQFRFIPLLPNEISAQTNEKNVLFPKLL